MRRILLLTLSLLVVISCSTTRVLPEGAYRLASNKVEVVGKERIPSNEISGYIRQQPNSSFLFGWNPLLNIYNWSDGSGKGINGFWERVGVAPVVFDPAMVESSKNNIAGNLQALGWYGSRVDAQIEYKNRLARVKYIVTPGKRYSIDRIVYEVPDGEFGREFSADSVHISIRPGDILSEKTLEAETVRSSAALRDRGYYDLSKNHYSFEADTLSDLTTLYYRVRGYTRNDSPDNAITFRKYHIGKVSISHPAIVPFKETLLRKFNTIHSGDLYSERLVNVAYTRYSALKLFNNVTIGMSPADSATVDCDIRLSGSDMLGVKLNMEASTNSSGLVGFSPQLTFYHKNIFHGGEWLNLSFSGNWQWLLSSSAASSEFGVTAGLSFPRLLGYPVSRMRGANIPRTEISASFNYRNRPEYRRNLATLSYGFSGQAGRNLFYQFNPLQLNLVKLYDIHKDFAALLLRYPYQWDTFDDHLDLGIGGTLYYTTNSDVVPKTPYHYGRFSMDVSGNLLSLFNGLMPLKYDEVLQRDQHTVLGVPYKQYVRAELDLGKVFRFGWNDNQALALHFVAGAGWAYGNSTALPFEKQFFCGGASSMRGWQARMLGPGSEKLSTFFVIPSQTGNLKLEGDVEYRFPSIWKLEFAVFAEAGNVWMIGGTEEERFSFRTIALDWGLGARINLDVILLRLDFGFRLRDPGRTDSYWVRPVAWFKEGAAAIHFGVGYPF